MYIKMKLRGLLGKHPANQWGPFCEQSLSCDAMQWAAGRCCWVRLLLHSQWLSKQITESASSFALHLTFICRNYLHKKAFRMMQQVPIKLCHQCFKVGTEPDESNPRFETLKHTEHLIMLNTRRMWLTKIGNWQSKSEKIWGFHALVSEILTEAWNVWWKNSFFGSCHKNRMNSVLKLNRTCLKPSVRTHWSMAMTLKQKPSLTNGSHLDLPPEECTAKVGAMSRSHCWFLGSGRCCPQVHSPSGEAVHKKY